MVVHYLSVEEGGHMSATKKGFMPETKTVNGKTLYKSIRNGKPEWFKHFCLEGINDGYRAAIDKFFESKHSHMVFGEGIYWD